MQPSSLAPIMKRDVRSEVSRIARPCHRYVTDVWMRNANREWQVIEPTTVSHPANRKV